MFRIAVQGLWTMDHHDSLAQPSDPLEDSPPACSETHERDRAAFVIRQSSSSNQTLRSAGMKHSILAAKFQIRLDENGDPLIGALPADHGDD